MMYGYGMSGWWMMLMPLLWIVLVGAVVWAIVKIIRPATSTGPTGGPGTARQILDRRFATGEIDETTYTRMRTRLDDAGSSPS